MQPKGIPHYHNILFYFRYLSIPDVFWLTYGFVFFLFPPFSHHCLQNPEKLQRQGLALSQCPRLACWEEKLASAPPVTVSWG